MLPAGCGQARVDVVIYKRSCSTPAEIREGHQSDGRTSQSLMLGLFKGPGGPVDLRLSTHASPKDSQTVAKLARLLTVFAPCASLIERAAYMMPTWSE